MKSNIAVYPEVESSVEAGDLVSRVIWHFAPYQNYIRRIIVPTELSFNEVAALEAPYYLDPDTGPNRATRKSLDVFQCTQPPSTRLGWTELLQRVDLVIVWRLPSGEDSGHFDSIASLERALGRGTRIVVADRVARPSEGSLLLGAGLSLVGDIQAVVEENHQRFLRFAQTICHRRVHLFGTGPSLEQAQHFDNSGWDSIVCNSIVANPELLTRLQPKALCAADPIFHAGPSSYAGEFRRQLLDRMQEFPFFVFVPMRDLFVYKHALPESMHDRLIGVPFNDGELNLSLKNVFAVSPVPNVLTLLMIPLGATLYKTIGVTGCDGRPLEENDYFWGHHKRSQFGDKMQDIRVAHPGFFSIDYGEYYEKHCDQMERHFQGFENGGGRVVGLSASYIPALRRRGAADPLRPGLHCDPNRPCTLLSLNPDLTNRIGHFWNYEAKLAPQMQALGFRYRVAANVTLDEVFGSKGVEGETVEVDGIEVDPCLTTHSWALANRGDTDPEVQEETGERVRKEMEGAVSRAIAAHGGEIVVYMYTGSLPHLKLLYEMERRYPGVRVVVNLFWLKAESLWHREFSVANAWLLRAMRANSRPAFSVMTQHQARALSARLSVPVAVAPHPSPLLSDCQAESLIGGVSLRKDGPTRIFFPSADRVEKGSTVTYGISRHLVSLFEPGACQLLFRTRPVPQEEEVECRDGLGDCQVVDGHIEEEQFVQLLAESDVVVLPYFSPDFSNRTSGLLIDALYCGTPCVVLGGTWLAEVVEQHDCGVVVEVAEPEEIARATYLLARRVREGQASVRTAAKSYWQDNRWSGLAKAICESVASPSEDWSPKQLVEAARLAAGALPVLGDFAVSRRAELNYLGLAAAVCRSDASSALLGGTFPLAGFEAIKDHAAGGVILAGSRRQYVQINSSSRTASRGIWNVVEHSGAVGLAEVLTGRGDFPKLPDGWTGWGIVVLTEMPGELTDAVVQKFVSEHTQFVGLSFGSDQPRPAESAVAATRALAAKGFDVFVVERWACLPGDQASVRRVVRAPYMPTYPTAPCDVIAIRGVPLAVVRDALAQCGENTACLVERTAEDLASEQWAAAIAIQPDKVLAAASLPSRPGWALAGTQLVTFESGFALVKENEEHRVHRLFVKCRPVLGEPLTMAFDVEKVSTRFISLWLSDAKSTSLAESTFDLEAGTVVSVFARSALVAPKPFAGIVRCGEGTTRRHFRVWLTVGYLNSDQEVLAQLVLRSAASGSLAHVGSGDRQIRVRNALVERSETPSVFVDSVAHQTAPEGASSSIRRNSSKRVDSSISGSRSMGLGPARGIHAARGLLFPFEQLRAAKAQGKAVPSVALTVQERRLVASGRPLDLLGKLMAGGKSDWNTGREVLVKSSPHEVVIYRNGGDHKDQFYTELSVVANDRYQLDIELDDVEPRLLVLVDGRIALDTTYPKALTLQLQPRRDVMRLDFKAVDSQFARFSIKSAMLRPLQR